MTDRLRAPGDLARQTTSQSRRDRVAPVASILITVALIAAPASSARAGILLAADSYVVGPNPAAGQYTAGELKSQPLGLTNLGFATGGYTSGSGTAQFGAASGGLDYAPLGESSATSGRVAFSAEPTDNLVRSVARNLSPITPPATTGTYFMSLIVSQDGTAVPGANGNGNGFVLAGFGNFIVPVSGATAGNLAGLFFGFAEEGPNQARDLILRARTTATMTATDTILVDGATTNTAQTFAIVAELNGNDKGSIDSVNWWVNPTNLGSVDAMTRSSLVSGSLDTYAFQSTADFQRLTYTSRNFNGNASFDGARLATSLDALVGTPAAVPEPGSLVLLALGLASGAVLANRRRPPRTIIEA